MSRITIGVIVAAIAVAATLVSADIAARPTAPVRVANGCEWEWAGPATGWVLVESNCPSGETCPKPGFTGQFVGQTAFQPCQASGSVSGEGCGCGR